MPHPFTVFLPYRISTVCREAGDSGCGRDGAEKRGKKSFAEGGNPGLAIIRGNDSDPIPVLAEPANAAPETIRKFSFVPPALLFVTPLQYTEWYPQLMSSAQDRITRGFDPQSTQDTAQISAPVEDAATENTDTAESEDDLQTIDPSLLGQAVVFGTDWTAATLIDQLRRGNIKLDPIFQRRDAWNPKRKSSFIESIVLGLPIPQIVLAEAKDERGSFLVIDGKQRLLSLQQFAGIGIDVAPLALTGLKFRGELNTKTYDDFQNDPKLRNYRNAFDNQPIRTVVVKNWQKEDVLYLIFHRLNSETLPLSPQELRQALHPGPFLRFAAEYTQVPGGIHKALGIPKADFRMRDVELFVRYIAFQYNLSAYTGNLKSFLDNECKRLNDKWGTAEADIRSKTEQMEEAIRASYEIFGDNSFRKYDGHNYETRFNRAIFDVVIFYFSVETVRKSALAKKVRVKSMYEGLSGNSAFIKSVETTTKSLDATRTRFLAWGQALSKAVSTKITLPSFPRP